MDLHEVIQRPIVTEKSAIAREEANIATFRVDPAATKEFRYWRQLASINAFMSETVDIWNGAGWDNVFSLAGNVTDPGWIEFVVDVSAYTNADFQIRFGHEIIAMQPVGPAEPSWSVDA